MLPIDFVGFFVLVGGGFPGFAQTYDTTTNALLGFPAQFTYGASFPVTSISAIHLGSGNAGVGVLTLVAPPVGGFLVPLAGLLNGLVALSDGTVVWTCYHPVYEPSNGSYQYPATVSAITFTTTIPIVPSGATSLLSRTPSQPSPAHLSSAAASLLRLAAMADRLRLTNLVERLSCAASRPQDG
jgi:hypothetical protein